MKKVEVNVSISGMDEVQAALNAVEEKTRELRAAISRVNEAVCNIGMNMNQPTDGAAG